jgi:hypothetical protein
MGRVCSIQIGISPKCFSQKTSGKGQIERKRRGREDNIKGDLHK